MAVWTVPTAASAVQLCLLVVAGAALVFLLCQVAALVHSAGRRNPSTAAANAQADDQSGRKHPPVPAATRPVVSVEAFSCEAPACDRVHAEAVAQPDVPTALDQALKRTGAGALKAAAPCRPCALGSRTLRTAHAAADGSAVIRKCPQQQQRGSKSSLRAATPSPRPSTRRPAQQAALMSPKLLHAPSTCMLALVSIDTCPDSDISTPSSSPCAGSPAGFAWDGAHAETCADLSCSASTPTHGVSGPAADTSSVAGLIEPTQQVPAQQEWLLQAGTDGLQHSLTAGEGNEGNSSSACLSTSGLDSVLLSKVLQDNAGTAQPQLAMPSCTACGGFGEPMHACTGLLHAQPPAAQIEDSTAQLQMPGGSNGSTDCSPRLPAKSNRQQHVRFAPLPPSKNIWLQQLRQMPPDSKDKFMRRLQSIGRKVWCMWRKRQQVGRDLLQRQGHGLKRNWQEAAAKSGLDSVDEPAVSPCKRLMFTSAE